MYPQYGRIRALRGFQEYAHRVSWEMFCGEIPAGQKVLHRCDVSLCVNPDHLFLGTQKENVHDCEKKGRGRHPSGLDNLAYRHGRYAKGGDLYRDRLDKKRMPK